MARSLIISKAIKSLFKQGGWLSFKGGGRRQIILTASANQLAQYNIYTKANSPADVVDVILTINSAVELRFGLITGTGWASGSTIKIINHGSVYGLGHDGGTAARIFAGGPGGASSGQDGLPAFTMNFSVSIDNTDGWFYGGGGGGGAGGWSTSTSPPLDNLQAGGGGGGGGRGFNNAPGGGKGVTVNTPNGDGFDGSAGSGSAAGAKGAAGSSGIGNCVAGTGGDGGDWGLPGGNGQDAQAGNFKGSGSPGGAAGNAVKKNGYTLTWIAGSSRVSGPVSD